jgi:ADP-dependent NAD(P)H-hydrate dehydratase / NAD(P)H-hydrate epimerase
VSKAGASPTLAEYADVLGAPGPSDDKYSRGVLGVVTGSTDYPGAAVLGVEAALHAGVGMVRYRGPQEVSDLVLHHRPEAVVVPGRVTALVVGSGCLELTATELDHRLEGLTGPDGGRVTSVPVVVDAGALGQRDLFTGPAILTPHRAELDRLAKTRGVTADSVEDLATQLAVDLRATMVVKGSETLVVSPAGHVTRCPVAPAWLATAGTGDVLAGVIGTLVAVREASVGPLTDSLMSRLAVAGVLVHRQAALIAQKTPAGLPGPFTALCLARATSEVVARTLAGR